MGRKFLKFLHCVPTPIFFLVAYNADEVVYNWKLPKKTAVDYEGKLQLSQFDIMETAFRGLNYSRGNNMGTYSVLQVVIALQRHTGYFLIQIYLPCTLLVVLSWVGFWLNREATSDRVGLGTQISEFFALHYAPETFKM